MKLRLILMALLCMNTPVKAVEIRPAEVVQELSIYALSLVGTPYRYGGKDPVTGLDCSGFIQHVYSLAAGIDLPRSSRDISERGDPLLQAELQAGDLVFFNTLAQPFSHVGVYVGENRFIHASSSKTGQVMISDMTQPYWSSRYDGARRLIVPAAPPLPPP